MTIEIPTYIGNNFIYNEQKYKIKDLLVVNHSSYWDIKAAIKNATLVQEKLAQIETIDILKVLTNALKHFYPSLDLISKIIGSDIPFLTNNRISLDIWYKNLEKMILDIKNPILINHPSSPSVCIIPSNSDQESLFILTQTLLSKSASIIRASNRGVGAYVTIEFIKALNKSIDEINDSKLNVLKSSISLLNILSEVNYLNLLSVEGWNYILFGSQKNIELMKSKITTHYRKIISYGTGLAMTIIWDDADLKKYIDQIIDSIVVNSGNECVSTDIIYIHPSKYDEFIKMFNKKAILKSKMQPSNINFTKNELFKRGLLQHLRITKESFLPSLIPLTKYDSTIEYPAPIASIRKIKNDLKILIEKDLGESKLTRNIATSIFTENNFEKLKKHSKAHLVKHNIATHNINLMIPHSGINLIDELMDKTYFQI